MTQETRAPLTSVVGVQAGSMHVGRDLKVEIRLEQGSFLFRPTAIGVAEPVTIEPVLDWIDPSEAIEDGEANLFSLLRWDYRLVDTLHGRDAELKAILDWAEHPSSLRSARLITGEGGIGKTRLAAEAARHLRERGWTAGFLPRRDAFQFDVKGKGLLLIVDYPEEQPARTQAILDELGNQTKAPYPFRVLFLSRRSFDEWEQQTTQLQGRFGRQAIAAPAPLSEESGLRLVEEAATRFAGLVGKTTPDLAAAVAWLKQSPLHRVPLYATAAAVHAVLAPKAAFGLGGHALLKTLALREIDRVRPISKAIGLGENGLAKLLALAILGDGLSETATRSLINADACGPVAPDGFDRLTESPWWRRGRLTRLEPDAFAAEFFDLALFGPRFPNGEAKLSDWLFLAVEENAETFGGRLARLLYDLQNLRPDLAQGGLHSLEDRLIEMIRADQSRAASFHNICFQEISHWAVRFQTHITILIIEVSANSEKRAKLLNNITNFFLALGERDRALDAAQEAVGLYRILASAQPDAATPDLAMSLNNFARCLSELGRQEQALEVAREAADLFRALVGARPDIFAPHFATSLNNLAAMFSYLGRREEALTAAEAAVNLYRSLAIVRPEAFLHDLATSLNNLANILSELGRLEQALQAAQEAVDYYRVLVSVRPDAFTHHLAMSLNTLANSQSNLGRREQALDAAEDAVDLYRLLTSARPDAFTPELAMSLNNLANALSGLGRREGALHAAQEAANLYRALASVQPDAFTPNLAGSLNTLTNMLSDLGRPEQALDAAQEAVNIHGALASARPDIFTPDLARSLNNLTNMLSDLGRREEAHTAAEAAANLYRALASARPDAFTPHLAMSLSNLARRLSAQGRWEQALEAAEAATDLYRTLASAQPNVYTPNLARSLNNFANALSDLGRRDQALEAAREAVDLYRALASARPDAFTPDLAGSLNNLANRLSDLGRSEQALEAAREAVDLYTKLVSERPEVFGHYGLISLQTLAMVLGSLGRTDESAPIIQFHEVVTPPQPPFTVPTS